MPIPEHTYTYIALFHELKEPIDMPGTLATLRPRREAVVEDAEVPDEQRHIAHALIAYVAMERDEDHVVKA